MTCPQHGQQFWQQFHWAHLFFLVYITKLHKPLESVVNLFVDDYIIRSLFSKVQWRIYFNPAPTKHAQEFIFKQKSKEIHHQTSYFNVAPVTHTNCQKHLGVHLDKNLLQHIKEKTLKAKRDIIMIGKLRPLPQSGKVYQPPPLSFFIPLPLETCNPPHPPQPHSLLTSPIAGNYQIL